MPPSSDIIAPAGAEHNTLYVAIEISRKSWVVGIKSPASERIGLHSLGAADVVGLKDLIEHQQTKAERALGREVRVLCCYEAGYEGFWLARWLDRTMSVETVVLDPASLLVNRKAKQRKTDRIDARKMVRALLAHDRGDAAVLSRVRIPSVEEEDRKRLLRERRRLVKERTSLTNAVKGLLKLHGIFDLQPRAKGFEARFAEVRTAYGSTFPPRARQDGAFDHPTPGLDDEALHPIGSLDDLGLEIGQDAGQGAVKDRPLIGADRRTISREGKQTEQGRQQRETAVAMPERRRRCRCRAAASLAYRPEHAASCP